MIISIQILKKAKICNYQLGNEGFTWKVGLEILFVSSKALPFVMASLSQFVSSGKKKINSSPDCACEVSFILPTNLIKC